MNSLLIYVFAITIVCAVVSCSKTGPAGPTGPAGATGNTGTAGPAGPKGDTGVANVIYSSWLDAVYQPDTVHNGAVVDTVDWFVDINAPKLTTTILTTGEIKVYVNLGTATQPVVIPMPYFDGFLNINAYYFLNTIELVSTENVSSFTDANNAKRQQVRYILIPGAVHGRYAVDWNNYEAVKKYLGLKD